MPLKVLYVTYLGLLEPISQAQIVPYLSAMSKQANIAILSFEKKEIIKNYPERLAALQSTLKDAGIKWHRLSYHKRPRVLSSVYDMFAGFIVSLRLIISGRIKILHARSNIPIAIGFLLKKFTGIKLLYDRRGIMGEDHLEHSGWKKNGLLYRFSMWFEKIVIRNSEAIVVLTNRMNSFLRNNLLAGAGIKPFIETIPCCVSLEPSHHNNTRKSAALKERLNQPGKFIFVYSGSVATYNLLGEMLDFFKAALSVIPNSHFLILSHTQDPVIRAMDVKGINAKDVTVTFSEREDLMSFLSLADAGLVFRRPSATASAASPTKFAEYLACGLPVISTPGIGDLDEIINTNKIGVVLGGFDAGAYKSAVNKLLAMTTEKEEIRRRCRETAAELFSLERGVRSYLNIYSTLE